MTKHSNNFENYEYNKKTPLIKRYPLTVVMIFIILIAIVIKITNIINEKTLENNSKEISETYIKEKYNIEAEMIWYKTYDYEVHNIVCCMETPQLDRFLVVYDKNNIDEIADDYQEYEILEDLSDYLDENLNLNLEDIHETLLFYEKDRGNLEFETLSVGTLTYDEYYSSNESYAIKVRNLMNTYYDGNIEEFIETNIKRIYIRDIDYHFVQLSMGTMWDENHMLNNLDGLELNIKIQSHESKLWGINLSVQKESNKRAKVEFNEYDRYLLECAEDVNLWLSAEAGLESDPVKELIIDEEMKEKIESQVNAEYDILQAFEIERTNRVFGDCEAKLLISSRDDEDENIYYLVYNDEEINLYETKIMDENKFIKLNNKDKLIILRLTKGESK